MAEPEAVSPSEPAAPPPEEDLSLSDHESRFSAEARQHPQETPVETPAPEAVTEDTPHVDDTDDAGPRDPATGRFLPKPKSRHRAASAIATPEDSPRIRELTARLRAVEVERNALKARTSE